MGFKEQTMIQTKTGFKPIENIEIGNYVMTHNNFKKVINTTAEECNDTLQIISDISDTPLYTSRNQMFYVYKDKNYKWVKADDLQINDLLVTCVNTTQANKRQQFISDTTIFNPNLWYLFGLYVSGGYIKDEETVVIVTKIEQESLKGLNLKDIHIENNRTYIKDENLVKTFKPLGTSFSTRHLNNAILDLSNDLLKEFIRGFQQLNGNLTMNSNKTLLYDLSSCFMKLGHNVKLYQPLKEKQTIEVMDFINNDYIYTSIKEINLYPDNFIMYNITTEDNYSYQAQNIVTSDLSNIEELLKPKEVEEAQLKVRRK